MLHLYLLIKPASGQCNLKCKYCFYTDETQNRECASYGFMHEELLENIVIKAFDYASRECTFSFQGGEPALIGLGFYKALTGYVRKHNNKGLVIHYALQTNGVLIDEAWAEFFAENGFLIGLSMDGTRSIHNMYRLDRKGQGSHSEVLKTAKLLSEHNVDFNVLTVVTAQAARHIAEIYGFYKKNKLIFHQFIPCIDPMYSDRGRQNYSLTPELFGKFLCNLFDLWYSDITQRNFVYIRYFENLVGILKGFPPECCGLSGVCAVQNVIEADGGVYPCDYYVLDKYRLGNLNCDSFMNIDRRRKEIDFIGETAKPHDDCLNCRYGFICHGGCRRDRFVNNNGTTGKNYFCEGYKAFFTYASRRLVLLSQGSIQYKNIHRDL